MDYPTYLQRGDKALADERRQLYKAHGNDGKHLASTPKNPP